MAPVMNLYQLCIFVYLYLFIQLPWFIWWLARGAFSMRPSLSPETLKDWMRYLYEVVARYNLQPFKHQPLPSKDEFRLLKVERWRWGLLHCSLQSFPLDSCPAYTALSYTWADPKFSFPRWVLSVYRKIRKVLANFNTEVNTSRQSSLDSVLKSATSGPLSDKVYMSPNRPSRPRLILCDGKALYITQNLYDALLLIPRSGERIEMYWWIDQICIDQSNIEEKNVQIPLMGKIYGRASNVAAWLGTPWFFERWTPDAVLRRSDYAPFEEGNAPGRHWYKDWDLLRGYIALLVTFGRAWFQRVWIVQELILAKRLTFFLGARSIASDDLVSAARRFDNFFNFYGFNMLQPMSVRGIVEVFDARKSFDTATGWPLERWLQVSRGRQASERKDFLFAGLGLLAETEKCRLKVDYSKTAQEVFAGVTESLLLNNMGTEALCLSDRGGYFRHWMSQGQNSWEINLDFTTLCVPLPRSNFSADPTPRPSQANIEHFGHAALLHVQGVIVDEIEKICELSGIWAHSYVDELCRIILAIGGEYSWTKEHPLTAIARTLSANQCSKHGLSSDHVAQKLVGLITTIILGISPDQTLNDFAEWPEVTFGGFGGLDKTPRKVGYYECYQDLRKAFPDFDWKTVWDAIDKKSDWDEILKQPVTIQGRAPPPDDKFTAIMRPITKGRNLFITKRGLIGLGSSNTEIGDEIAILQGSRVPFILSQASHYRKPAVELKRHTKALRELVETFEVLQSMIEPGELGGKKLDAEKVARFKDLLQYRTNRHDSIFGQRMGGVVFKGEAYVHGLMNGEVADMMSKDESLSWRELTIC